jgi:hypothetical protein
MLLSPALISTVFENPGKDIFRFAPITLLIILFPYEKIKINVKFLSWVTIFILLYLVSTQLLMSLGNTFALNLRDNFYTYESIAENQLIQDQGVTDTIIISSFGGYRSGGLFYNPNVLASNLFLFFSLFHVSSKYLIQKNRKEKITNNIIYIILLFIVSLGLFVTGSRTGLATFFIFIFLDLFKPVLKLIKTGKINKYTFFTFTVLSFLFINILFRSIERFADIVNQDGSFNAKNTILVNYIYNSILKEPFNLIIGGNYSIHFDADWGFLISSFGILGLLSVLSYYFIVVRFNRNTFPAVMALCMAGFGNTIIYNLATSLQVLILMILYENVRGPKNLL